MQGENLSGYFCQMRTQPAHLFKAAQTLRELPHLECGKFSMDDIRKSDLQGLLPCQEWGITQVGWRLGAASNGPGAGKADHCLEE